MPEKLTAESLLQLARTQGIDAFGVEPRTGTPQKILLASLGLDVADPDVQRRLVEMLRDGEILLDRIDWIAGMPADRVEPHRASVFYDRGTRFDCISIDGAQLLGADKAVGQ